jgi:hypothetical protein
MKRLALIAAAIAIATPAMADIVTRMATAACW